MLSLIDPVIRHELAQMAAGLARVGGPTRAERLGRLRGWIALYRCPVAAEGYRQWLAAMRPACPDLGPESDFTPAEAARIARGWPLGQDLPDRLAAVRAEAAADADLWPLWQESRVALARFLGLSPAGQIAPPPPGPIRDGAPPGLSLVTCAMNRSGNLLAALPSWLAQDEIDEIVIVDWSSTQPVSDSLAAAGIRDGRIRVARVEGEARWVLSWAFNLGFRLARFDRILKLDADIVLGADFFARNRLGPGQVIAGNWRVVPADQAHLNGSFLVETAALAAVGGFNEALTGYGWDDEELYARLGRQGRRRVDVAAGTLIHLPHDDQARTGQRECGAGRTWRQALGGDVQFLIWRNRLIAERMAEWTGRSAGMPFAVDPGPGLVLRRGAAPVPVPEALAGQADLDAAREVLSWRLGPEMRDLDAGRFQALLDGPALGGPARVTP